MAEGVDVLVMAYFMDLDPAQRATVTVKQACAFVAREMSLSDAEVKAVKGVITSALEAAAQAYATPMGLSLAPLPAAPATAAKPALAHTPATKR